MKKHIFDKATDKLPRVKKAELCHCRDCTYYEQRGSDEGTQYGWCTFHDMAENPFGDLCDFYVIKEPAKEGA